ncbi:MFS transporter [Corynebacterium renale]|uniref:MHS family alpha-ketoglutarate permease-like MFS transporter n=1 Tax=Corynebacterium renale TaxID=1724 RepID=A0A2A9DMI2_9CORY|nr:MFS transporter [Corynebacterium renale]PFG27581.1 MHS family alpha-ketoglutarate permease-like MFS transporter [Corynebacterium renale]SQI23020.1 shikimate transport protein ShiA [Corynebacterium renale]
MTTQTQPAGGKKIFGALIGSAMEVFDWSIYTTFAAFFAFSFFGGGGSDTQAFINSLVVFAVGFIARPIGSLLFGYISDVRGRRVSLFLTSLTALIGTLLIALAPSHAQIGVGAAIILVVARVVQGLAHGGEQPAAGAYIAERSTPYNRGALSSLIYVSIMVGSLLATLLGAVLTSSTSKEAMIDGLWRVPFLVGGLGSLIALYFVWRLEETEVFEAAAEDSAAKATKRPNLWKEMARAWRPALQIIGLTLGITIAFQNWAAMVGFHISILHADPAHALWTAVAANILAIIALPLWGALSDKIGRKPVLIIGFVGLALSTYPLMQFLDGSWQHMLIGMGTSMVLLAAPLSILPALMAELVPTSIRTIGVGFSYALATAIFGGTVPALQAWIGENWSPQHFGIYVTLTVIISLIVTFFIPETRGKDLSEEATTADMDVEKH